MKMKIFLTLMLLLGVTAGYKTKELLKMYREKKEELNMNFPRSRADEKEHFKSFCQFANMVQSHNAEEGAEWQGEINKFSMMTDAEKEKYHGLNISVAIGDLERETVVRRSAGTEEVELEERQSTADYTRKLPPIKNQGGCGSCWAFGAVAALEYQVNRKSSVVKALSEQQYLDCVYEGQRNGCNGGWPTSCYDWTKNNNNLIASQKDYPYNGRDGTCRKNVRSAISGYKVGGAKMLAKGDAAMLAAVQDSSIGVLSVAIGVVNSFHSFKSGVYSGSGCTKINHAVDVVGYGTLNSVPYWNVRNSWGANWGDRGYIKMRRGSNMCSIASYAHYPLVTGSGDGDSNDDRDNNDESDGDKKTCTWKTFEGKKLKGKMSGIEYSKSEAARKCMSDSKCVGISCRSSKCMLNKSMKKKSHEKFVGYVKVCQ